VLPFDLCYSTISPLPIGTSACAPSQAPMREHLYALSRRFEEAETGAQMSERPSKDDIVKYAKKTVDYHLHKFAKNLPEEQKDEVRQEAMIRVLVAYENLDTEKSWKTYVQQHCKGAVLDYLRAGNGFEETGWIASDKSSVEPTTGMRLTRRIEIVSGDDDSDALNAEDIAGLFGMFDEIEPNEFKPNFDLLFRMSGVDQEIHLITKLLLGFNQTELAEQYEKGITRERLSQKVDEFFKKLDAPEFIGNRWIEQTIFALGLCEYYTMPNKDNGQGWEFHRFDLFDQKSFEQAREYYHPSLAGTRGDRLKRSDIFGRYKVAPKEESESTEEQSEFDLDS
jgi:RNA polymerase sigma factor (sigma-70 family)